MASHKGSFVHFKKKITCQYILPLFSIPQEGEKWDETIIYFYMINVRNKGGNW